jgi:hypothetical protein
MEPQNLFSRPENAIDEGIRLAERWIDERD